MLSIVIFGLWHFKKFRKLTKSLIALELSIEVGRGRRQQRNE